MILRFPVRKQSVLGFNVGYSPRPCPFSTSLQRRVKNSVMKNVPQDMGLAPGTFIMPTGIRKPSVFGKPRERLRLEWYRLRARVRDFVTLFAYKFIIKPGFRRMPKLHRRKIVPEAMKLHSQMYTAFAEGDTSKLSQTCTEGLLSSFRSRIASRPRNQRMRWILHKYLRRPRIVSDRAVSLPIKHSALRQVVLRMDTRQSLAKLRAGLNGSSDITIAGTGEQKDVKEYLVLQRRILQAQEGEWVIWGTTDETDLEDIIKGKEMRI